MIKVPYIDLAKQQAALKPRLLEAVSRVLDHGQFILGPEVEAFERRFADYCGASHAVGVGNGTESLVLALRALGVGPGDEVITVSHSFVATGSAIALAGATPVFVEVGPDQLIDPAAIKPAITAKTKAIIPVHLTGAPARMDAIMEIANRHGLKVVEDAAQAAGAHWQGRPVGSWGHLGSFSLHPLKNLAACGDGGVLTTNDPALAERLRILRNIGLKDRDTCVEISGNSRLDAMHAAMLMVKMDELENITQIRRSHAQIYQTQLKGLVELPVEVEGSRNVYHLFVIQTDRRDALKQFLWDQGIDCKIHYPRPIHRQPAFARNGAELPATDRMVERILSLPIDSTLAAEQILYVCERIRDFFKG